MLVEAFFMGFETSPEGNNNNGNQVAMEKSKERQFYV
jgi:hypothetical protein